MDKLSLARLPLTLMCSQSLTSLKGPGLRNVQGEEEGRELKTLKLRQPCRLITRKTLRFSLRRLTLQSNTLISLRSQDLFLYSRVGSEEPLGAVSRKTR